MIWYVYVYPGNAVHFGRVQRHCPPSFPILSTQISNGGEQHVFVCICLFIDFGSRKFSLLKMQLVKEAILLILNYTRNHGS